MPRTSTTMECDGDHLFSVQITNRMLALQRNGKNVFLVGMSKGPIQAATDTEANVKGCGETTGSWNTLGWMTTGCVNDAADTYELVEVRMETTVTTDAELGFFVTLFDSCSGLYNITEETRSLLAPPSSTYHEFVNKYMRRTPAEVLTDVPVFPAFEHSTRMFLPLSVSPDTRTAHVTCYFGLEDQHDSRNKVACGLQWLVRVV